MEERKVCISCCTNDSFAKQIKRFEMIKYGTQTAINFYIYRDTGNGYSVQCEGHETSLMHCKKYTRNGCEKVRVRCSTTETLWNKG